eukprot:UN34345
MRDQLAYLFSLLALMYVIEDGWVHTWEAAILLIIYILYLLIIVFAHGVRVWYIKEVLGRTYHEKGEALLDQSDIFDMDEGEEGNLRMTVHEAENMMMGAQEETADKKFTYISFHKRPAFTVKPSDYDKTKDCFVASADEPLANKELRLVGMQIMEIGGINSYNKDFTEIQGLLEHGELPLIIKFQEPEDCVESWTREQVKQWWMHDLPPACRDYVTIVDDCHIDGSDLLDLDLDMLAEFGVKKIHGMKILKS